MSILDAVEVSLRQYRPKTHRQFVIFNIASRFNDLQRLARYLNNCQDHPKRVLLEAARLAELHTHQNGGDAPERFFAQLDEWRKEQR